MIKQAKTTQTVSKIQYHFVFCPRLRRKIFKSSALTQQFETWVREIAAEHDFQVEKMVCYEDHVYLYVSAPPVLSPTDIMTKIKFQTSKWIREEFKEYSHLQGIWTRAFLVSTDNELTSESIKNYIEKQKTRC